MRILIVSQYFWPENFRITDLAKALQARGHEVTVLTGMPNYPAGKVYDGYTWWQKRYQAMDGVTIVRVPLFARRKSRSWQLMLNYFSFALSACLLAPWMLRAQSFDCVFTFEVSPVTVGIPAILLRWLKKSPMIFWVQDLWPETLSATGAVKSPPLLAAVAAMVKIIYRHSDKILVQSKSFVEPVIAVGGKRKKIEYFPNWAESLYQPIERNNAVPERQLLPSDGFIVMFAGNLGEAQSLETIVNAAKVLHNKAIHWVFLGDGRKRNWLESEQIKGLEKIHVLGSFAKETMPTFFSCADAMLVTLRDDPIMSTTIPGKVQSYLACGKPLLGALNGAGADVINESKSGFCVPSGDYQGLADAVLKMQALPENKRQRMGQDGRIYFEKHFNRDSLVEQLESWMNDISA